MKAILAISIAITLLALSILVAKRREHWWKRAEKSNRKK